MKIERLQKYYVKTLSTYGDEDEDDTIRQNNIEYPELIRYVEDETCQFIIAARTKQFWKAKDFFADRTRIKEFFVEDVGETHVD